VFINGVEFSWAAVNTPLHADPSSIVVVELLRREGDVLTSGDAGDDGRSRPVAEVLEVPCHFQGTKVRQQTRDP